MFESKMLFHPVRQIFVINLTSFINKLLRLFGHFGTRRRSLKVSIIFLFVAQNSFAARIEFCLDG